MSHLSKEGCSAVLQNLCWAALHRAQQIGQETQKTWKIRHRGGCVMCEEWCHGISLISWHAVELSYSAIPWIHLSYSGYSMNSILVDRMDMRTWDSSILQGSAEGRNRGDDPRICRSLVNNIINIWLYNLLITYLQILIWSQLQKLKEFDSVWSAWHATRMFHMFQQRNHRIRIPIQFNTF